MTDSFFAKVQWHDCGNGEHQLRIGQVVLGRVIAFHNVSVNKRKMYAAYLTKLDTSKLVTSIPAGKKYVFEMLGCDLLPQPLLPKWYLRKGFWYLAYNDKARTTRAIAEINDKPYHGQWFDCEIQPHDNCHDARRATEKAFSLPVCEEVQCS